MNVYSLKFNIWFYMVMCILIALTLVLCVEIFFIRNDNSLISRQQLRAQAEKFVAICEKEDYENLLARETFPGDVKLALFETKGGVLWSTDEFYKSDVFLAHQADIIKSTEPLSGVDISEGKRVAWYGVCFTQGSGATGKQVYVYAALDVGLKNTTVRSLIIQRVIISAVVFVVAAVACWFISKQLVRPVSKVSGSARQVADGAKDVSFEKTGYTEIDRLSDNLSLTAAQLAETDELKNELMANVSHDLKTPLTLIRSYAEMIRDLSGDNKEKRTEHCNVIITEADRLTALVCDLVDLSKLNADAKELRLSDFDIGECVEEAMKSFGSLTDFVFDTDIEKGIIVFADRNQIRQVVYNLVGNAVNYSDDDKYVKVSVKRIADSVRVDVIDRGCGIAKEDVDKVWDRYYRTNRGHKREITGSGLGLSIVKGILSAHNARFGVESTYGEGSDFYFILTTSEKTDGKPDKKTD